MEILTFAGIPITIGATEAVHRQRILDEEAEAEERQEEFYLDVFCDAKSSKKDEVHDTIVVLKDGKVYNYHNLAITAIQLTYVHRSVSGPKIRKPSYQPPSRRTRGKHHIPSQASTYLSPKKTSHTSRYHIHPPSVSSAPCPHPHRPPSRN